MPSALPNKKRPSPLGRESTLPRYHPVLERSADRSHSKGVTAPTGPAYWALAAVQRSSSEGIFGTGPEPAPTLPARSFRGGRPYSPLHRHWLAGPPPGPGALPSRLHVAPIIATAGPARQLGPSSAGKSPGWKS